jgi:Ni2+-binding GTPase involved in maturation of urease and hydrogenase
MMPAQRSKRRFISEHWSNRKLEKYEPSPDIILIESAGDNITLTFSPSLAGFFVYMVDVAAGTKR